MGTPTIKSGKLVCGADVEFGEHVVVDVAEEVVLGDRCTIGDGTVLSGRRVEIGADFYGYSWSHPLGRVHHETYCELTAPGRWLDVGRGRKDDEDAVLKVGERCTFHDNKIDLARSVTIGDDVGLSPEVWIMTHHYWMSPLDGFPMRHAPVTIGDRVIVYSRSILTPGCVIGDGAIVGAHSVCVGKMPGGNVYAGNPTVALRKVVGVDGTKRLAAWYALMADYQRTLGYRGINEKLDIGDVPHLLVRFAGVEIDPEARTMEGSESELSDDLRDFLFKHGVRIYTKRRFRKMGKQK